MSYTSRDSLESHICHSELAEVGASLNEVEWDVGQGVTRDIENDDVVRMQMKENGNDLQVSACNVDELERVVRAFFLLMRVSKPW